MELSIVIVSWNTCDLLVQCLTSIKDELETLPSLEAEILVVDNASTDGTVEVIHKQFQKVCVIENKENGGFAHANNQAIRKSQGKYV
ncbi:MAG: glycosyltransferase, partial [Aliifodinibius sp.]|nr:glycosyltransferase [Fodinibius sp.]NIV11856.1 glycosyltransferase [Fodinibius sp.]NIY25504.1 glycosyltransferase [Fodinibius sp.]